MELHRNQDGRQKLVQGKSNTGEGSDDKENRKLKDGRVGREKAETKPEDERFLAGKD